MALAPVGIQVRALDAAQAKADIAGVKTETQQLVAENRDLAASNQQVKRTTDQATQSQRQDKQAVDALTQAVQRQNSAQSAGLVPMQRGAAAMQNFGHVANQLSFQVQDFFVQMASGQSLMMAFAQQAPQAAGAFSMLGGRIGQIIPYVGTVIAIGAAFAPMLMNWGDEAVSTEDKITRLADAVDRLSDLSEQAGAPLDDMIAKYGALALQAQAALKAQMDLHQGIAMASLRDALTLDAGDSRFDVTADLRLIQGDGLRAVQAMDRLRVQFQLAGDDAHAMADAFTAIQTATALDDQVRAASDLAALMVQIYGSADAIPAPLRAIYDQINMVVPEGAALVTEIQNAEDAGWSLQSALAGLPDYFTSANGAAQGFLGTMREAADEAWRLANARVAAEGLLDDAGSPTNMLAGDRGRNRPQRRSFAVTETALYGPEVTGGRGGGGRNVIDMEAERQRRAAEGYFTRTRTPQEEYASTVAELEALKSGGFLDGDTFTRAMQDAREQMDGVAKDTLGVGSAFSNLLSGMMDGAQTAGDAMEGFVASVLNNVLAKIMQPSVDVLGNAASSFISGFMPKGPTLSFDGGGWTGSGSRSGGLDGKGGYMAMIHPREYIHDTTKGAMPQQGGQQNVQIVPSKYFDVVVDERSDRVAVNRSAQTYRQTQRTMPGHIANLQGRGLA